MTEILALSNLVLPAFKAAVVFTVPTPATITTPALPIAARCPEDVLTLQ
jgi:hypothetical protein